MRTEPVNLSTAWQPNHIRAIADRDASIVPVISEDDVVRATTDIDIWDAWPVQDKDGMPSRLAGDVTLWMALGAPCFDDPDERHSHARIHLLARDARGAWHHLGPAMPDGFSPGSREWSGSAVLAADRRTLTLYFTATGRRGEAELSFEQRLFQAEATLASHGGAWQLTDWRKLDEMVVRDPAHYMASDAGVGKVGSIKAFRDPAYFHDPETGQDHLFFAASLSASTSAFNGVIGSATAAPGSTERWIVNPPLVSADGLNNELERPHIVRYDENYYLFWSTQQHVFNPDGPIGPTGLYGMVAKNLADPWRPLNGTGLVFGNPSTSPAQSYSWLVLPDLSVISFIDDWGEAGRTERRFGATFAPLLHLQLQGARGGLISASA